jgi:hypothetical protein
MTIERRREAAILGHRRRRVAAALGAQARAAGHCSDTAGVYELRGAALDRAEVELGLRGQP